MHLQILPILLSLIHLITALPQQTPCPSTPHPTLPQYRLAYHTYCTRHFTPSRFLVPNEKLVFTYSLTDARGRLVFWVLSAVWEQGGFLGGGSMEVGVEACLEWFGRGEGECVEREGGMGVRGWKGKRGGVRVEARRRGG
ncbi:hypothetical protein COCCADRAFT_30787 [Bipolaris zeicola 26-R-13]|uniref:Uncharacterized protein n=1 Tax=Cochliobolus carbonum (strain 26-R-13) TaxID=930089 RepID=W6XR78_COCC2|nr:uncharacterized protein COCCADRAFT_30787 [Bipolaris zeicola 26-R-13]EUC27820.1 hypothetical protein COCCADRAFT_30787 [Bipolaris zeicola 26-R-13]